MRKAKKAILAAAACLTVLTAASALAACSGGNGGGGGTVDKSSRNADFVAYRKKVVSVLKDNGIFVNDLDGASSRQASVPTAVTASYTENKSQIAQIIEDANATEDYQSAKDQRDSIFEQSFYISLVIGDALSNVYGVQFFYDIPVYFDAWGQYFEVVKSGDKDLVRCYAPAQDGNSESVLTMELDYKSAGDYSFTAMQIWDDQKIYAYGNSQKEYFMVCRDTGANNNNFMHYMPQDGVGYFCNDESAVSQCYELIKGEVEALDSAPIVALKDRNQYSFTEKQAQDALDKYFKQSDISAVGKGLQVNVMGGKQVATAYFADGETTVEIPDGTQYIAEQFLIEDKTDAVTSLKIPSSVKAVVDGEGNEIAPEEFFRILVNTNEKERVLSSVTVGSGSTLFKADAGSLYTADGELVYLANSPLSEFSFDIFKNSEVVRYFEDGLYTRVFDNIHELTLDANAFNGLQLNIDPSRIMEKLNLTSLTVTDESGMAGGFALDLKLSADLTINVALTHSESGFSFVLDNVSGGKRNVTVNVNEFALDAFLGVIPKQPEKFADDTVDGIAPDGSIFTTFNINVPRDYFYFFMDRQVERDTLNSVINLQPSENEAQFDSFSIRDKDEYADPKTVILGLADEITASEITVPAEIFGYTVNGFIFDLQPLSGKSVRLNIPQSVNPSISEREGGVQFNNEDFILHYEGNFDELKSMLSAFDRDEESDIIFTAECADKTALLKLGYKYNAENPDNYPYKATINYNGASKEFKLPETFDQYVELNIAEQFELEDTRAYYLVDAENNVFKPNYVDGGALFSVPANSDLEYDLVSYECGITSFDLDDTENSYSLSVTAVFTREQFAPVQAVITDGTVIGKPLYIEPHEKPDGATDNIDEIEGVHCCLFEEFELPLENDGNILNIRVKIIPTGGGELKLVYISEVRREVTVELCDGSRLNYTVFEGDGIPFDETEWKIEDGYAYYLEYTQQYGDIAQRELCPENGMIYRYADNLTLKRIALFDGKPFALIGDNYNITGTVSVKRAADGLYGYATYTIDGTVCGEQIINDYFNGTMNNMSVWVQPGDTLFLVQGSWDEMVNWTLLTQIDGEGNLTVTGFKAEPYFNCYYSNDGHICALTVENGEAKLSYTLLDGDNMPVPDGEYYDVPVELREFTEGDRADAETLWDYALDEEGNTVIVTLYVHIEKTVNPDGSLSFVYVSYTKETTPYL
ncbi:MAG: hypothetical protein NC033_06490 [Clostridiales bacterium]|nr:hypothetical protein [Clostridiales bacterium]